MTKDAVLELMDDLKNIFDMVRLVEVSTTSEVILDKNGTFKIKPLRCFEAWRTGKRCANCISAKAVALKGRQTKFEFESHKIMSDYCSP